jgi:hypothetical protein
MYILCHYGQMYAGIPSSYEGRWNNAMEKLTVAELVKKFAVFYRTRIFITIFITARHLFLSWARWIQSTPYYPVSLKSMFILPSHIKLGLPNDLFPSGF